MFLFCETQWRWSVGLVSMRIGLDHAAVNADIDRLVAPERRADVLCGLRLMEIETLRLQAERAKQ